MTMDWIKNRKIDCHTHIVSPKIREEYFQRTTGFALVMQFPESIMKNPDCIRTVQEDDRLFLNASVDLKRPIPPQLSLIEENLERWKVVGLKLYLSYQSSRANDPPLYPIYEFARRHRLTVTFHTGLLYRKSGGGFSRSEFCSGPYGRSPVYGMYSPCGGA